MYHLVTLQRPIVIDCFCLKFDVPLPGSHLPAATELASTEKHLLLPEPSPAAAMPPQAAQLPPVHVEAAAEQVIVPENLIAATSSSNACSFQTSQNSEVKNV